MNIPIPLTLNKSLPPHPRFIRFFHENKYPANWCRFNSRPSLLHFSEITDFFSNLHFEQLIIGVVISIDTDIGIGIVLSFNFRMALVLTLVSV